MSYRPEGRFFWRGGGVLDSCTQKAQMPIPSASEASHAVILCLTATAGRRDSTFSDRQALSRYFFIILSVTRW